MRRLGHDSLSQRMQQPVVIQFQNQKAHFAGNADVSSALSAKREMILTYQQTLRTCRRIADGTSALPV